MNLSHGELARICRIADEHGGYSRPSAGKSLQQLVADAGYAELRSRLRISDLEAYLRDHPELMEQWESYSQDKRTSDGWYFWKGTASSVVGYVGSSSSSREEHFASPAEGCAQFIVRELDSVVAGA